MAQTSASQAVTLSTHDLTRRSTCGRYRCCSTTIFQLTTSHGGRQLLAAYMAFKTVLSTHDLTRRSTVSHIKNVDDLRLSTHDLTRRSTISSTTLTGQRHIFQLTTSHGGRRAELRRSCLQLRLSTHDLTRRSTTALPSRLSFYCRFNSRPHTEVDFSGITCKKGALNLSTHDLTRRSTYEGGGNNDSRRLSTHDLTRRSTETEQRKHNIRDLSTHDLTRRSTGNASYSCTEYFFQLTTSHGGRPIANMESSIDVVFQLTTSHGGRLVVDFFFVLLQYNFQLTTSHGGRPSENSPS